jgi:hypothetical protein
MADESKIGKDWQADELDAIVAGYFGMLAADISGRPYIKSRHSAALMTQIGRTHRSVEFKHQNISAVLDELGMPSIPGYKPKRNYQNAIFDAIDRHLSRNPDVLQAVAAGEEFVIDVERRRLTEAARGDLARKIRWIAAEGGDGAGYGVLSASLRDRN